MCVYSLKTFRQYIFMAKVRTVALIYAMLMDRFSVVVGLVGACGLIAVVGVGLQLPTGPVETVKATVVGFRHSESEVGTMSFVEVKLGAETLTVPISAANSCRKGGDIWIQRQRHIWGMNTRVDYRACPPSP